MGTMHAFPATSESNTSIVFNGGNGAGSIADASGESADDGGAGASQRPSTAAPGGNAWRNRTRSPAEGEVRSMLDVEQFPALPTAEERMRERNAQHFSLVQRKAERDARKAARLLKAKQLSEQQAKSKKHLARQLREAEEAALRPWDDAQQAEAAMAPARRLRRGVAKQQRIKELKAKMERRATHQAVAGAQPEAENLGLGGDNADRMVDDWDELTFSREQALVFTTGNEGDGGDARPTKSLLQRAAKRCGIVTG